MGLQPRNSFDRKSVNGANDLLLYRKQGTGLKVKENEDNILWFFLLGSAPK